MTENSDKLDNMTVRRFAKLIKGNSSNNGSTGITTGTVIQNDNQLFVAVDDETLVPVSDTASNVNVGDKVTLAIDNEEALIVGNNSDASPTASELSETDTKATFAKVDASEAKDTAQTAQVTANTAQNTAETAQTTADNAQSTAQTAKETADAVDGKATEAKETATQAQATATTASETATQAQTTANTAKETADTASTKADNAQSTADTAQTTAETAQARAEGAEKVATDFIDIDDNKGITVGDMTAGTLGKNTYINKDGISIRDGETALASFNKNQISLGQNSFDSKIQFNSGLSTISANKYGTTQWDTKGLELNANNSDIVLHGRSDTGGAGFQLGERSISCGRWESSLYTDLIPLEISVFDNIIYLGKLLSETSARTGVEIEFKDDGTISLEAPKLIQDGKQVSVVGHNHASDALTPATINTTSTIKQNGTQVSLEGHTHEAKDLTTSTPIFYLKTLSNTYTCSGTSYVAVNFTIPAITGYTCVGCVGWQFGNSSMLTRGNFAYNTKTWSLYGYNRISSSVSGTAKVKLLYVKSGWISCS